MIEFQSVSVQSILTEVSFTAEKGRLTALIGRNGAGKSTLFSCAQDRAYSGNILLEGRPLSTMTQRDKAKLCALMPQVLPSPSVTVLELVSFGRTPYLPLSGRFGKNDAEIVERAIETTGLKELCRRSISELSGGERRRAFFAMTLAQDTPNILLDEPTTHLDMRARFEFMEILENIKKERAVLAVLHELTEVMSWADKIVTLDKGKKVFEGTYIQCIEQMIPEKYFGVTVTGSREQGFGAKVSRTMP